MSAAAPTDTSWALGALSPLPLTGGELSPTHDTPTDNSATDRIRTLHCTVLPPQHSAALYCLTSPGLLGRLTCRFNRFWPSYRAFNSQGLAFAPADRLILFAAVRYCLDGLVCFRVVDFQLCSCHKKEGKEVGWADMALSHELFRPAGVRFSMRFPVII